MKDKEDILRKLHRQFSHPRREVMEGLLNVKYDKESRKLVTVIHKKCATCKRLRRGSQSTSSS